MVLLSSTPAAQVLQVRPVPMASSGTGTCEASKGSDGTFISIENGTDILLESGRTETIKEQLTYCEKAYEDYRTVIKSLQLLPK